MISKTSCRYGRGSKARNWKGGRFVEPHGYVMIYAPGHPRANGNRYVREHILIAEKTLGKPLPINAVVHHHNENMSDNITPGNLVICQDRAYHKLLHQRMRALKHSGDVHWRKCKYCHKYDTPDNLTVPTVPRSSAYHKSCATNYLKIRKSLHKGG